MYLNSLKMNMSELLFIKKLLKVIKKKEYSKISFSK